MRNRKQIAGGFRTLFAALPLAGVSPLRLFFCLALGLAIFGGGYFMGQRRNLVQEAAPVLAPSMEQDAAQSPDVKSAQSAGQKDAGPEKNRSAEAPPLAAPGAGTGDQEAGTGLQAGAPQTAGGALQTAGGALQTAGGALQATQPALPPSGPRQTAAPLAHEAVASAKAPEAMAARQPHPFARDAAPFILRKMGSGTGPTLLVIGGIQGDEPGGFSAAALLASHYHILSGNVWVVPDLNFPSILKRHRGIFGDMNRKFAALDPDDPEFDTIAAIKAVLLSEQVDLILNLHDGSGFYRPTWEDGLRNPKRWGQSVIIDQDEIEAPSFNMLFETAGLVESEVNRALLDPVHRYHTYNTLTAEGNKEMAKTLSWFAVCNGKPAFGIEASKEVSTDYRAYYHLNVIEAFMRRMDIVFERDFALSPSGVTRALNSGLALDAFDGRLLLELDDVRPVLNHVPFKSRATPRERASKPLLALVPDKERGDWRVAYGNRTLTRLNPDYLDFDYSLSHVEVLVDGQEKLVPVGEVLNVDSTFMVRDLEGYRVNAIGAQREVRGTEAGVLLEKKDFMPRFSVDKKATLFRVEIYRGKAFAGMLLVRFTNGAQSPEQIPPAAGKPLTASQGHESNLGW